MTEVTLQIKDLTKKYHTKVALDHFSYDFVPGVYGLLGPNGAGKSTLMKLITRNLAFDEGELWYRGKMVSGYQREYIAALGYMPQQQRLYDTFTGLEFLYYMASLKGLHKQDAKEQILKLLGRVHLVEESRKRIETYSGGMKQRLLIAQALLGDPKVVLMDEPTAGLDPKERIHIRNLISEFARDRVVLIATHVVSDIEHISRQILLLDHGQLVCSGTAKELTESIRGKVYESVMTKKQMETMTQKYRVIAMTPLEEQHYRLRFLTEETPVLPSEAVVPSLEDVYLYHFTEEE